jgi:hypothetical protein
MLDVNGQSIGDGTLELVKFAETASAVNEITVTNSATGNAPEIASSGDDTNIDLKLTPKGTGKLNLDGIKFPNADGSAGQALVTDGSGVLSFATAGLAWQSVQTTGFTAVKGNAYPCNTTSAGFTVTLPATPSAGDQVQLVDYAGTFDSNALTIDPNGEDIEGTALNFQLTGEREGVILTYIDSTQGWIATSGINEGTDALELSPYSVDFLAIAGGGGGGGAGGGGGGAGGYRNSFSTESSGGGGSSEVSLSFIPGTVYTVTVGAGGAGATHASASAGTQGTNSSISGTGITTITSTGGGGGGHGASGGGTVAPTTGGSGGGAGKNTNQAGASGTANQGYAGGTTTGASQTGASGGGGAGAVGGNASFSGVEASGDGGAGLASSITGSSVTRGGGGGGGANNNAGSGTSGGTGGTGGGGSGSDILNTVNGGNGTANTGGAGGGAEFSSGTGGTGGSGVVILRMPTANYSGTTTGSPTVTTDGSDKVIVFNSSGSITG